MEDREKYIFRKATADEVQTVFQLVLNRIHWMDEKGITEHHVSCLEKDWVLE